MNRKLEKIIKRLADERSRKILLVSHCILNENSRYLGGAFCGGINPDVLRELSKTDYGIIQMPCPEQLAWWGVLKKIIWLPVETKGTLMGFLYEMLFPLLMLNTYIRYSMLAAKTVKLVADYVHCGFEIVGVVGIDGSPTCGMRTTVDMKKSLRYFKGLSIASLERNTFNENFYKACLKEGQGVFIKLLMRKLKRKGILLKKFQISIIDEMNAREIRIGL